MSDGSKGGRQIQQYMKPREFVKEIPQRVSRLYYWLSYDTENSENHKECIRE